MWNPWDAGRPAFPTGSATSCMECYDTGGYVSITNAELGWAGAKRKQTMLGPAGSCEPNRVFKSRMMQPRPVFAEQAITQ